MTVAIKLPLVYTSYRIAVERYAAQGRSGIVVGCISCRQSYFLFFGPEMSESEAQQWFYYQAKRDYPHKANGFSIGEPFPEAEELALERAPRAAAQDGFPCSNPLSLAVKIDWPRIVLTPRSLRNVSRLHGPRNPCIGS